MSTDSLWQPDDTTADFASSLREQARVDWNQAVKPWTTDAAFIAALDAFAAAAATRAREAAEAEIAALRGLINTPHVDDFLQATRIEAAHQCERWGVEGDAGKTPQDWFWLLGYLAGKALAAAGAGNRDKALHHTISSAAVLLNWHAHMSGERTRMRPGIAPPKETP